MKCLSFPFRKIYSISSAPLKCFRIKKLTASSNPEIDITTEVTDQSQIYFEWQNNNGNGDFYELCRKEGLAFEGVPVIYYKE